jgi:hypothetical protein
MAICVECVEATVDDWSVHAERGLHFALARLEQSA